MELEVLSSGKGLAPQGPGTWRGWSRGDLGSRPALTRVCFLSCRLATVTPLSQGRSGEGPGMAPRMSRDCCGAQLQGAGLGQASSSLSWPRHPNPSHPHKKLRLYT